MPHGDNQDIQTFSVSKYVHYKRYKYFISSVRRNLNNPLCQIDAMTLRLQCFITQSSRNHIHADWICSRRFYTTISKNNFFKNFYFILLFECFQVATLVPKTAVPPIGTWHWDPKASVQILRLHMACCVVQTVPQFWWMKLYYFSSFFSTVQQVSALYDCSLKLLKSRTSVSTSAWHFYFTFEASLLLFDSNQQMAKIAKRV